MGVWDEFCLVCGGPPWDADVDEIVEDCFEESEEEKEALRVNLTGLEWLHEYVGVLETEELIPLGVYDSYGGFNPYDENSDQIITAAHIEYSEEKVDEGDQRGLTCHEKCYTLLQKELGYTLRFQDAWPMLMKQQEMERDQQRRWTKIGGNSFRWSSYGGIGVYQGQEFSFTEAVADGNAWMLQDPTTHERNAKRIVDVWRPILESGFKIPAETENNTQ